MERKQNWKSDLILRGRKDPAWWIENVLGDSLWSRQLDVCKSVVDHERTAVVACVDKDTEILTETRGWQLFKDLLITDKVASLVNEQLVFVSPLDYFEGDYDGDLIGCKNDYMDFLVTPNHRCLVSTGTNWTIREASELLDEDVVFFKTPTDVCITHVVSSQRNDFYKQKYTGKIYCVQVSSGIILIRRNGVYHWTGNSFGVGKCVAFGERIILSDGSVTNSENLIGNSFKVLAWDEKTGRQIEAEAFAEDNGLKPVCKITTTSGRCIVRTENHPLYTCYLPKRHVHRIPTLPQWRPLNNLRGSMAVAVPLKLDVLATEVITEDEAKLIGYLLGDGGTTTGLIFTQKLGRTLDEFRDIVNRFNCDLSKIPTMQYDYRVNGRERTKDNINKHNPLLEKFRAWGLTGTKAKHKYLPDFIWKLQDSCLALIMNRLFACDGWVYIPKTARGSSRIAITLASEKLIRDIELVMLRLGIYGNVSYGQKSCGGKKFDAWTWQIIKGVEILKFIDRVGIFGKEDKLEKCREFVLTKTSFKHTLEWPFKNLPEGYVWEQIRSIEYLGLQPTVGICVPEYNTYLTTFVEHNTHLAARLALWFLCCFKPSKVVSTAPCFDDETEILTDFGWKLFKDLNKQEKVASLVDGELKFVTPLDWMQYAVEGELLGYKGRDLDFLVTPQHKLYTHRHYETEFSLVRADEVYGKWDYRFNRHCVWEGVDDDFTENAYELFGFWMADGSAFYDEQRRAYGIYITQSKHISYVEDLLTKGGFKYSKESKKQYDNYLISIDKKGLQGYNFVVYSKDVASWFIDNFGRLKIDRRCPQWLRNAPIYKLKAFLRGFMLADGCEQKDSKRIRVYGNKGLADDLQEIGLKAGYVVNSHWQYCGNRLGAIIEDSWALNFLNSDTKSKEFPATNKNHWYKKQYVGNVYCVEVPSNIILVRRNGVYHWSGNTLRQVKDLLWSELRTAHKNAIIPIGGELLQLSLKFNEDHFCVGFSTDAENLDKFTGLHQSNLMVIFDQAGGIDPNIWQAAEGLMTSANCKWLAISNSAISDGELANICMPDRKTRFGTWNVMRIKASESPNVLAGKNIIPGLVAHDWVKKREEAWGRDDPLYKIFVEAEFIPDSEMVVVPYNAVIAAFNSVGELGHSIEIGLDVARMGTDSTVWTAVSGSRVLEVKRITGNTTMQVVGETVEFVRHVQEKYGLPVVAVKIDVIGLGAGVYDRMIELADESIDIPVVAVNNAEVQIVVDKERYSNVRAEMAWAFRYRMEQGGVGLSVVFTHDYEIKDYIRGDIQAMRYKITSQGKIQLLPKDILKKTLGRSPDYWDSLVMAFETPGGGIPSVEFLTNKEEKAEEFQISEEEWQVLMGTRVPIEGSHFIDFGF